MAHCPGLKVRGGVGVGINPIHYSEGHMKHIPKLSRSIAARRIPKK